MAQALQEVSLCGRLAKLPLSPVKLSGQQKLARCKETSGKEALAITYPKNKKQKAFAITISQVIDKLPPEITTAKIIFVIKIRVKD